MKIFKNTNIPKFYKNSALAIGNFDGVHKGHQKVFKETRNFADKKKIKTIGDLKNIINSAIRSSKKTIMIAIYNNQNQRRYIGVNLN